jgi:PAS domain S-box-containing protein
MESRIRILLIEDNPGDARLIQEYLSETENISFFLEHTDRLTSGLDRLRSGGIDVVLLDLGLPDSEGLESLRRVLEQTGVVPIIVFTAIAHETLGLQAIRDGAQDYLVKGQIDGNLIIRTIRYAIERKRAEEALNESEEHFRCVTESANDAIISTDSKGIIIFWNRGAEKMFSYKKEEVLGKSLAFLMPQRYRDAHQSGLDKVSKKLGSQFLGKSVELKGLKRDGSEFQIELSLSTWKIGEKTFFSGILRDITERKRIEEIRRENERLMLASKAKSEFLANMSHELRTPLNSIIGFSQLLRQNLHGELNNKQEKYVYNVISSSKLLLNLIDGVLDLSRIEAGKMELFIEKMQVSQTINETLDMLMEKASRQNVIFKKEFDPHLEFIDVDKQKFKQILFNLVSNAVKFSKPEGGTVTIIARKEGDNAKFLVSDTGIGIRKEDIGRLFKTFEQLDSGISRKYGGTGLGLAISKKLVELHGGEIWADSKYGEGTTFTFFFPISIKT